jgi:Family of unknown function (DUF6049)
LPTDRTAVDRARDPAPDAPDLDKYPDALRHTRSQLQSFATLLPAPSAAPPVTCTVRTDPLLVDLTPRVDVSGAVDLAPATQRRFLSSVNAAIARLIGAVDAPRTRQTITLTARDGKLPLVLRNRLPHALDVVVELDAGTRIEFPEGVHIAVRLEPGTQRIPVPVRTRSPGSSPLRVRVTSPDGGLLLASTRYSVRSTAVSGIGAGLTVGALLFLVLWWGRHWRATRRARAEARHGSSPGWSGSSP